MPTGPVNRYGSHFHSNYATGIGTHHPSNSWKTMRDQKDITNTGPQECWDTLNIHKDAVAPPDEESNTTHKLAKTILKWLIDHEKLPWYFTLKGLFSITFWRSNELTTAAREALLSVLDATTSQLQYSPNAQNSKEKNLASWGHICHLLSILPYLGLPENSRISIPILQHNQWNIVSMRSGRIPLNHVGSPSYAYTLTPELEHDIESGDVSSGVNTPNTKELQEGSAPPAIILFMGTAPPTSLGALVSLWSDFVPFTMVGQALYSFGAKKIEDQIAQWNCHGYKKKRKILAIGQSLGGALAQLCCAHHPKQVRAIAINAPQVSTEIAELMETKLGKNAKSHLRVQRFNHENDWVCRVGHTLLPGTQSHLFGHHDSLPQDTQSKVLFNSFRRHSSMIFNAHTKVFPVHLGAEIIKNNYRETQSPLMNRLHQLGCFLFFLPLSILLIIRGVQYACINALTGLWTKQNTHTS